MRRHALILLLGILLLGTTGCGNISSHVGEDGSGSCAVVCEDAFGKSILLQSSVRDGQPLLITGTISGKAGAVRLYEVDEVGHTTIFPTGTDGTFSATIWCSGTYQIVAAYTGFTGNIAVCSMAEIE